MLVGTGAYAAPRDRRRVAMVGAHGARADSRRVRGSRSRARSPPSSAHPCSSSIVARRYVQPALRGGPRRRTPAQCGRYAFPLFAAAISLRLFDKLDLFVLKALGGSASARGTVRRRAEPDDHPQPRRAVGDDAAPIDAESHAASGGSRRARELAGNAIRGVLLLFPFAGVAAGASTAVSDHDLRRRVRGSRTAAFGADLRRRYDRADVGGVGHSHGGGATKAGR